MIDDTFGWLIQTKFRSDGYEKDEFVVSKPLPYDTEKKKHICSDCDKSKIGSCTKNNCAHQYGFNYYEIFNSRSKAISYAKRMKVREENMYF